MSKCLPQWPWRGVATATRANTIVGELEKSYPSQTVLKVYWLPTIRAAIDLNANNAAQSLMQLEAAAPYELGEPPQFQLGTLYPAYLRGEAQLMAHNGAAAATEFQKVLDHRGIVVELCHSDIGAPAARSRLRYGRRQRQSEKRVPEFSQPVEGRRP